MYGLPNPPAYRIGNRFLNYNDFYLVDALERAVGDAATLAPAPDLAGGSLAEVATIPPDADELWDRVRGDFDVATVRDRRYLEWRFVARPGVTYSRLALRDASGTLAGLVVLRHDWLRAERNRRITAVAEWIVDRRHPHRLGAARRDRAPRARRGLRGRPIRLPAAVRRVEAPRGSRLSSGPDGLPPRGRDV